MRFSSLGGSNAASYAAAGKAVASSAASIFKKQSASGSDYAGLAQAAMEAAANRRIAGIKAAEKLTTAATNTYANTKQNDYKLDMFKTREDSKNKQRMAGGIAAIGRIAGAGFLASKDNTKGRERPKGDVKSINDQYRTDRDTTYARQTKEVDAYGTFQYPSFTPGTSAGKVTGADGGLVSSAQALDAGKGSSGKDGKYNLQQMTDFAIQGGFSSKNARIMAAISMGESGGNADIDTVKSGLDPNKSNEFSVGLSQINVQAHGDKLKRRGWSEADLRDPVKNMTIAKEVYDEVGSFNPWSVFDKGLHNQYLN